MFWQKFFFEKFYKLNGKIVNFTDTCASTHVHYFEKLAERVTDMIKI